MNNILKYLICAALLLSTVSAAAQGNKKESREQKKQARAELREALRTAKPAAPAQKAGGQAAVFENPDDGFVVPEGSKQYMMCNGYIYHKWYPQLLGQITKFFRTWSIYLGAENMTNYTQDNPIVGERVSGDKAIRQKARGTGFVNPHSANYDASMIWAPIHGWKLYLGFRWALEREE